MPRTRRAVMFLLIFLSSAGFDQGSKEWARHALPAHHARPVIDGYWDWELASNPGAAFSTFDAGSTGARVVLSLVAAIALLALAIATLRTRPDERLKRVALALIAGGALGNLIDRLARGAVTDFVRWHVRDHLWPVFNVADALLLVGVVILVIERAVAHRTKLRRGSSAA